MVHYFKKYYITFANVKLNNALTYVPIAANTHNLCDKGRYCIIEPFLGL